MRCESCKGQESPCLEFLGWVFAPKGKNVLPAKENISCLDSQGKPTETGVWTAGFGERLTQMEEKGNTQFYHPYQTLRP